MRLRNLVGHVVRFDFGAVAGQIPRVDLPDLVPFFKAVLAVRGRRPDQAEDLRLRFRPPEEWKDDFSIAVVDSPGNRNPRTGRMSRGSGCGSSTGRFGMRWN